jgi:hypothetical protein
VSIVYNVYGIATNVRCYLVNALLVQSVYLLGVRTRHAKHWKCMSFIPVRGARVVRRGLSSRRRSKLRLDHVGGGAASAVRSRLVTDGHGYAGPPQY